MKAPIIILLTFPIFLSAGAQNMVQTQKVLYLQTDKEVYQPEETIWFKAYICNESGKGLDTTIQNLYIDIYNASRKLIAHERYISYVAMAKGQFTIPKQSNDERYWLVAYRRNDVLADKDNYFVKMVRVFRGKNLSPSAYQSPRQSAVAPSKLFLKPEGQDLIISFHNDDHAQDSVHLRLVKDHQPFFEQNYPLDGKPRLFIRFPLAELPAGINTISLSAPGGKPIESREILVRDRENSFRPELRFDTLDLAANGANVWHLNGLGDANLSLSVTDADLPGDPFSLPYQVTARSTIMGKSRILAESIADSTAIIHDLTGTLALAPMRQQPDTTRYPLDRLITLSGKVAKVDTRKGRDFLASKVDLEFYHDKKQTARLKSYIINDTLIRDKDLFYFDTTYVKGYVLREGDIDPNYKIIFDTIYRPYVPTPVLADEDAPEATPTLLENLEAYRRGGEAWDSAANSKTLSTVVVKATYHDKVRMADNLYTSNYFTARDAFSLLLDDDSSFLNGNWEVGQYIASHSTRIRFILIPDPEYVAYQYNTPSAYFWSLGSQTPGVMLYLNENPVPYESIRDVPRENLSYVKIMPDNWYGPFNYHGPAIAFYTRKGTNARWSTLKKDLIPLNNGYTLAEVFDDFQENTRFSQWSSTLVWNPDVYSHKGDGGLTLRFRNNTIAHRFRIVIEGLTYDGKPVHYERVVEKKN